MITSILIYATTLGDPIESVDQIFELVNSKVSLDQPMKIDCASDQSSNYVFSIRSNSPGKSVPKWSATVAVNRSSKVTAFTFRSNKKNRKATSKDDLTLSAVKKASGLLVSKNILRLPFSMSVVKFPEYWFIEFEILPYTYETSIGVRVTKSLKNTSIVSH